MSSQKRVRNLKELSFKRATLSGRGPGTQIKVAPNSMSPCPRVEAVS